jgi:hypothetical protein
VRTSAGEPLISKRLNVLSLATWPKQSPGLCYSFLPHLLPSSPYRQARKKHTWASIPCSQNYREDETENVWIWSLVWRVQLVASEPQPDLGYYSTCALLIFYALSIWYIFYKLEDFCYLGHSFLIYTYFWVVWSLFSSCLPSFEHSLQITICGTVSLS